MNKLLATQNISLALACLLPLAYVPKLCHIARTILVSTVRSHNGELAGVLLKGLMMKQNSGATQEL